MHINSDKIRWASSNGQPACALAVSSVNPYAGIMWKSRYLQEPAVLKSSWSHKYHYNDLIKMGFSEGFPSYFFNGFNWQVYSIVSDKQKLPKAKLRTIYNKVASWICFWGAKVFLTCETVCSWFSGDEKFVLPMCWDSSLATLKVRQNSKFQMRCHLCATTKNTKRRS